MFLPYSKISENLNFSTVQSRKIQIFRIFAWWWERNLSLFLNYFYFTKVRGNYSGNCSTIEKKCGQICSNKTKKSLSPIGWVHCPEIYQGKIGLHFLICGANNVVEHYGERFKILHVCPFEGWPNKQGTAMPPFSADGLRWPCPVRSALKGPLCRIFP